MSEPVDIAADMTGLRALLGDNPMADLCVAVVKMLAAYDKQETDPQTGDTL